MNVAYHTSDAYTQITGISILSLFENNKEMDMITVYVLEKEMTEKNKNKLKSIAKKYGRKIIFIPMPDINERLNLNLKKIKEKWTFDSYCRIFLDILLPQDVNKVLYLDGDTLILNSLQELWDIDMKGKCAAGVIDAISANYYELLGLHDRCEYCNSGMILMDLEKWRNRKVKNRIVNYINKCHGYIFFMEQTVFNAILEGEILILHPKYNVYTIMQTLSYNEIIKLRNPKNFYTKAEVAEAIKTPNIVHLTGFFLVINRTWIENTNHPMKEIYQEYGMMSPWNDQIFMPDKRDLKKKVFDFVIQNMPRKVIVVLINIIYNNLRLKQIRKKMDKSQIES